MEGLDQQMGSEKINILKILGRALRFMDGVLLTQSNIQIFLNTRAQPDEDNALSRFYSLSHMV
jgi:hypothetical protein